MADPRRPLSPHIQIYSWQVQMVSSILHRATGIALAAGTLLVVWGLIALAGGESAYACFRACVGSMAGTILLIGWTWALFYHLCNGVRHLVQDAGLGFEIAQFKRSSWLSVILSLLFTVLVWGYALGHGGVA